MSMLILLSVWKEITEEVKAPKVELGNRIYVAISKDTPIRLRMKRNGSTKWVVKAERRTTLIVRKTNGEIYAKRKVKPGKNTFRIYLKKGEYLVESNKQVLARIYVWKKRKWVSVAPLGGGYPIILKRGEHSKYTYYRIDSKNPVKVRVKGPTTLYVYYRAILGKRKYAVADISIYMDGKLVKRKKKKLKASKKYRFYDGKREIIASKPLKLKLSVPEGVHTYEIRLEGSKGALKIYRSKRKKTRKNPFRINLLFKSYYTTNAYRYSQASIDTFNLGLKTYRYPNVNSIGDLVLLPNISFSWKGRLYLSLMYAKYLSNPQLDRFKVELGARYKRFALELGYIPEYPIRPTYYAPLTYKMLSYTYAYMKLSYHVSSYRFQVQISNMDYNNFFNEYDARMFRISVSYKLGKLRFYAPVSYIMDVEPTLKDWSNFYAGLGAYYNLDNLKLDGWFRIRTFLTSNVADHNYNRRDVEGNLSLKYYFPLKHVRFNLWYDLFFRSSNAPQSARLDILKDFVEHRLGVGISKSF